jgi:hypothetical protein
MRIECTDTFLDGRERFERGDIFTIDDAQAKRFVANKWAKEVGAPAPAVLGAEPATLDIQSASMGQKDNHG